ncbi:MAG: metallophosphoesterase [Sedimentisphaerales bacterium]|nr:metallophosphoesterase [Sedimentisphaerales bacterium]
MLHFLQNRHMHKLKATILVVFCMGISGCGQLKGADSKMVEKKQSKSFCFGIVADVQYANKDSTAQRFYRDAADLLSDCVEQFNQRDLAFVIQLGDLIDGGATAGADLKRILSIFNETNAPRYHVLGNHDFAGLDRETVIQTLEMERAWYDFVVHHVRFVVLDGMDLAVSGGWPVDSSHYQQGKIMLEELKTAGADNAYVWNGGIGVEQMTWLADVLRDAKRQKQPVLVFGHLPLKPDGEAHTLWNAREVAEMLEESGCVVAFFNGHRHNGGFQRTGGVHYITIEAMVEAPQQNAFAIVHVNEDQLRIEGFGKVISRTILSGRQ